jgi:hypothetical protein
VPAGGGWISFAHGLLPWLAATGVLVWSRARREGAWATGALLVILCLFYVVGRTMLLEWYLALIWLLWYPALFGGAAALATGFGARLWARPNAGWAAGLAASAAVLGLVFLTGPARGALELVRRPDVATIVTDDPVRLRTLAYREVAAWMNANAPASARLAATEIGTLGYYRDGYLIDSCALVSPEALKYLPVPMDQRFSAMDGVIGNQLVQDLQPEYVSSMQTFAARSIMRDPWFQAHYRQVAEFPLPRPLWGSTSALLWERVDPPAE